MRNNRPSIVPLLNLNAQIDRGKHPTALKVRFNSRLSLTNMAEEVPSYVALASGTLVMIQIGPRPALP